MRMAAVGFLTGFAVSMLGTGCGGGGGSSSGSCPLALIVDGSTYNAISCDVQGMSTFVGGGLYKISISAPFSMAPGPVRSILIVLNDHNDAADTHVREFTASDAIPGAAANYHPTASEEWSTLSSAMTVGSGSMTVTEYDRMHLRISGTFDFTVLRQGTTKHIQGSLRSVPMSHAD
jgi:hypothetical protein